MFRYSLFILLVFISFYSFSFENVSAKSEAANQTWPLVPLMNPDAIDIFDFTDVKETYCGKGVYRFSLLAKIEFPKDTKFNVFILSADTVQGFGMFQKTIKIDSENKVLTDIRLDDYDLVRHPENMTLLIESIDGIYRSKSREFTFITSHISAKHYSHCDGYSTRIDFSGKIQYESIQWQRNDVTIPGARKAYYEAKESGNYSAIINFKGCSVKSTSRGISNNDIPSPEIVHFVNKNICKGSPVPILYHLAYERPRFPYTDYEWYLDGKPIEKNKDEYFFARKPGVYTLIGYQGNCKSSFSNPLEILEDSVQHVTIKSPSMDSLTIIDQPITVCQGTKVELNLNKINTDFFIFYKDISTYPMSLLNQNLISFQWKRDGENLKGENGLSLVTDKTGKYTLEVIQGECIVNSNPLEIKWSSILKRPTINVLNSKINCEANGVNIQDYFRYFSLQGTKKYFRGDEDITTSVLRSSGKVFSSGSYYMTSKLNNDCSVKSDTVNITITRDNYVIRTDSIYTCKKIVLLSLLEYYPSTSPVIWKLNGNLLAITEPYLEVSKSGLYTAEYNENGCPVVQRFFVRFGIAKLSLVTIQGPASTCQGRDVELALGYNQLYDLPTEVKTRLYRNDTLVSNAVFNFYSMIIPVAKTGIYQVRIDDPSCETISNKIKVDFQKTETKITPQMVSNPQCANNLKISEVAGDRYQWYFNNQPLEVNTSDVKVTKAGTYYAKVERGDCVAFTTKMNVFPDLTPLSGKISGDTLADFGSTVNLKLDFSGTPPFSYKLNNNDEGLASLNKHLHPVKVNSSSTFNLTSVKNVCGEGTVSGSATIKVNVLADEPSVGRHIRIFPVPTTGSAEIEFDQLNRHELSFQIINMSGQVIISNTKVSQPKQKLDLNHLVPGEYLIRMQAGKEVFTRKIVKQ